MLWLLYYADEMAARYPPFRIRVYCESVLDRKVDRNTEKLQQTITDVGEQDPAPGATGRTTTNSQGQSLTYPPFGISEFLLRTLPELK